jgi:hypothetical protein
MHRLCRVQTRQCMFNSMHPFSNTHAPICQRNNMPSALAYMSRNSACEFMTVGITRHFSGTSRKPITMTVDWHRYVRRCTLSSLSRNTAQTARKPSNKQHNKQEATEDIKRRTIANLFRSISKDGAERTEKINKAARLCYELKDKRLIIQLLDQMEAINCPPDDDTLTLMLMVCIHSYRC